MGIALSVAISASLFRKSPVQGGIDRPRCEKYPRGA
jgi:hypothetical protein